MTNIIARDPTVADPGRLTQVDVGTVFADAAMPDLFEPDDIRAALDEQYHLSLLPRGGARGVADEVVAGYSPETPGVEALRALRSQLDFGWLRTTQRAALAVVSAARGDGRSWLVANLAALFAQAEYRTLVIDADMRRPRQHTLFNVDNSVGLSALLVGLAEREPALRVHEQQRLFVLPAGPAPSNPQELLAGSGLGIVIDRYAKQFDVILIDTPAAAETADAQIVAAHSGSALMLVRRHHTRPSQLTSAMKSIGQTQAQVIGSVVCEH